MRPTIPIRAVLAVTAFATATFAQTPLPTAAGALVTGSGACETCHSTDGTILWENGRDVSPVGLWRSSMMGNAAKDPLWRAMVTAETQLHPGLASVIEDKCVTCHAPLARVEALHGGAEALGYDEAIADPLGLDGVSCTLCHLVDPANLGQPESFSGQYEIADGRVLYGPYENPLTMPMQNGVDYLPVHGPHLSDSALCGSCHTLYTPFVDDDEQVAGIFPEQTPYLEWLNSDLPAQGASCQACHMPLAGPQDIATRPPWHQVVREPFRQHFFAGGNAWMLGLLAGQVDELGLGASEEQFLATRDATRALLATAAELSLDGAADGDSLELEALVVNRTGHKLPTGIPLRRLWLRLTVTGETGDTLFASGHPDSEGRLPLPASGLEPHHGTIRDGARTQIWEGAMGDVDGERTFSLLRAGVYLKDNRIPPAGFTSAFGLYDTVAVHGLAEFDPDFNAEDGEPGNGSDRVRYRLPRPTGPVTARAELLFQTVTPELLDHFDGLEAEPEIAAFLALAQEQGLEPEVLAAAEWSGSFAPPPPAAPTLRVELDGASLRFSWDAVPGATGYRLDRLAAPWQDPDLAEPVAECDGATLEWRLPLEGQDGVWVLRALSEERAGR